MQHCCIAQYTLPGSGVKRVRSISTTIGAVFAGLAVTAAWAEPAADGAAEPGGAAEPRVVLESAWIVAGAEGERLHVGADRPEDARDQLYTGRFRYEGSAPAAGLRIVLAVPEEMDYVPGSATGPGAVVQGSVDGGLNFAPPGELRVAVDPAAPEVGSRLAEPEEYTHLRWDLPGEFAPGVSGLVSFRARPAADAARIDGPEPGP
jgi:hypothetical protein